MATPKAKVQVTLQRDSLIPEDVTVNTFHFEGDDDPGNPDREHWDLLVTGLVSRVKTFYEVGMANVFASTLAGAGTIQVYDMEDAEPRVPRVTQAIVVVPGATALPGEVAMCLSFRGAVQSGANMKRRTGRVYLGPIASSFSSLVAPSTNDFRPQLAIRQQIVNAAKTMATGGAGTFRLAVYSPTTDPAGTNPDAAWNDVVTIWMDDAWDTIRSRGGAPTSRFSVTV